MARKQPDLSGMFKPTEPQPTPEAPTPPGRPPADVDRTLPIGVGLKASEVAQLDAIAQRLGIARNALMRFAVRDFLARYHAGSVTVDVETVQRRIVRMP